MAPWYKITTVDDCTDADTNTSNIDVKVVSGGCFEIVHYYGQNTKTEERESLLLKKEKQSFGKPLLLIGSQTPTQKRPYLNHRRNSARG